MLGMFLVRTMWKLATRHKGANRHRGASRMPGFGQMFGAGGEGVAQPAQDKYMIDFGSFDLWEFGVPLDDLDWSRLPTFRSPRQGEQPNPGSRGGP